jgi:hypothetical protein
MESRTLLGRLTHEGCCLVEAPGTDVDGDLRMRAEGAPAIDDTIRRMFGDDLLRRLSLFNPISPALHRSATGISQHLARQLGA